jgi:sec-independent protein translocase protein TatB
MFDIGWTELMVVGVVALIVVGPKDLPGMFRTLGRFTGKMKGMAREFQRAMDDAADQAGVKDVAKDLKNATSAKNMGLDKLNAAADKFEKWQPGVAPKTGDAAAAAAKKAAEAAKPAAEALAETPTAPAAPKDPA